MIWHQCAQVMRTTLSIEDETLERLREVAKRSKLPFREVVSRTLRLGLERLDPRPERPAYAATTFSMGFPPHLNLDKALHLAAGLEDDETARKLQVRK
jgi:hypothetical protein